MSDSPDLDTDATSSRMRINSPVSSSTSTQGSESPRVFIPRTSSPVSDIRKANAVVYHPYPIVIPTVRRAMVPETRIIRSPAPTFVPVITSGKRGSSPAGTTASSPGCERRIFPSSSHELLRCNSNDRLASVTFDVKSRKSSSPINQGSSPDRGATTCVTDSKQLKFGMERILSEPARKHHHHQQQDNMVLAHNVPCSECVSSLLRCCRLSTSSCEPTSGFCSPYNTAYYGTLHSPRSVRPYTNLLASEGVHMSNSDRSGTSVSSGGTNKRKRSWSRAVFSNLQRKGLEKRFQLQKYITKPDRRQLAATLGLTDAQVKVWFQNRRMKWRHSKEAKHQQSGTTSNENRTAREEQGGPDSTQEPEIDIQTLDS